MSRRLILASLPAAAGFALAPDVWVPAGILLVAAAWLWIRPSIAGAVTAAVIFLVATVGHVFPYVDLE